MAPYCITAVTYLDLLLISDVRNTARKSTSGVSYPP